MTLAFLGGLTGAAAVLGATPVQARGTVFDVNGSPVGGARVELSGTAGQAGSARSDSVGHFIIVGGHHLGAPDLLVSAPGFVPARMPASTSQVTLHRWPLVSGQARDEEGRELGEATVQLSQDHGTGVWTTVADEAGKFTFAGAIQPGPYHLSVSAAYHEPYRTVFDLALDQTRRLAPVAPRQLATVRITSQPDGQRPLLDGAPLPGCERTPCTAPIPVGPHELSIDNELTVPWRLEVWPGQGDSLTFSPVLERKTGTLSVSVPDLPGAQLRIDGTAVSAGAWSGRLPTGQHRVEFTSARTWPFSATTRVEWNAETRFELPPAQMVSGDANAFLSGLSAYLSSRGGRFGVYLVQLNGGRELGYGDNNRMDAASVIKLPVALYLYQQVEAGAIKLEDSVTLQDDDFMSGSGLLYYQNQPGDSFTYIQLVSLMIQQSDNTAWRALLRMLGRERVDAYVASLGAPNCVQATSICTPRAAGRLLFQLAGGAALNQADTQALIGLLETTVYNNRINYYLGDIQVAHKVGMRGGVINDSGIVYLAGNPFVISVFTDTDDPDLGVQVIRDVARAAAAFYGR